MWQDRAACQGEDPDLFFPRLENLGTLAEPAKICRRCPVAARCLAAALEHGYHGIWAATTTAVRTKMARRGAAPRASSARTTGPGRERRERYAQLRAGGYTVQEAAWELHVTYDTALRYEGRLRAGGVT